jgi:hypothetical protein
MRLNRLGHGWAVLPPLWLADNFARAGRGVAINLVFAISACKPDHRRHVAGHAPPRPWRG